MADKKINEVSTLTDFDYALVVKGNDVAKVSKQQLASIVGELIGKGAYKLIGSASNPTLHKIDFARHTTSIIKVVGEGNADVADDYSIVVAHGGSRILCITHNSGPSRIKMYRDNDYNYYVHIHEWGYAIVYFDNRVPSNNTISAVEVNIDVSTLIQVGI